MYVGIRDSILSVPFEDAFDTAQQLGFDGLEVFIGEDYAQHPLLSEAGLDRAMALRERTGTQIACFAVQAIIRRGFANPNPDTRLEGIHLISRLCRVAPQFDIGLMLLPLFEAATPDPSKLDDPLLIDGLRRVCDVAGTYGVTITLETPLSGADHVRLIELVGSNALAMCYDVGNAKRGGFDGPAEIRQFRDHIGYLHMKDTDSQDLGEGRVDFDAVAVAVREIGYDKWCSLETPIGDDPLASAKKNLDFTHGFLARLR